jgi:hypothetical protein
MIGVDQAEYVFRTLMHRLSRSELTNTTIVQSKQRSSEHRRGVVECRTVGVMEWWSSGVVEWCASAELRLGAARFAGSRSIKTIPDRP